MHRRRKASGSSFSLFEVMTTTGRSCATDLLAGLYDAETHLVELEQQVVRELEVGLVDLVDEQDVALLGREALAQGPELDVALDVGNVTGPEAAVVEPLHGVVDVQSIGCLGRGLDVPRQDRHAESLGDVLREHGLTGAGLALEQQRALERDGTVDGIDQSGGGDVAGGSTKA